MTLRSKSGTTLTPFSSRTPLFFSFLLSRPSARLTPRIRSVLTSIPAAPQRRARSIPATPAGLLLPWSAGHRPVRYILLPYLYHPRDITPPLGGHRRACGWGCVVPSVAPLRCFICTFQAPAAHRDLGVVRVLSCFPSVALVVTSARFSNDLPDSRDRARIAFVVTADINHTSCMVSGVPRFRVFI